MSHATTFVFDCRCINDNRTSNKIRNNKALYIAKAKHIVMIILLLKYFT